MTGPELAVYHGLPENSFDCAMRGNGLPSVTIGSTVSWFFTLGDHEYEPADVRTQWEYEGYFYVLQETAILEGPGWRDLAIKGLCKRKVAD